MAIDFGEWLKMLQDPVPTRRRDALTQLEQLPVEELQQFAQRARVLEASICLQLCPIFAGATRPALVDLLGAWASSQEPSLRERALMALAHVPAAARKRCMENLLDSSQAETRAVACQLLGEAGDAAVRDVLVRHLRDPAESVVVAAIDALKRLRITDAQDGLTDCLEHLSATVRIRALHAMVELVPERGFPVSAVLRRLTKERDARVQAAACWVMERRPDARMQDALLDALHENDNLHVRTAAARALASYPDATVLKALMHAGAEAPTPGLSVACGRSIQHMPEVLILEVGKEMLADIDPNVRTEAAALLAGMPQDSVGDLLIEALHREEDEFVTAALIEALGRGGWVAAWESIYPYVKGDPIVAYPAVQALAELTGERNVETFAAILTHRREETFQEAILKRLALFGRSNGLPERISRLLHPFFRHVNPKIAMLAFEAEGHTHAPSHVSPVLAAIESLEDEDALDVAAMTAMSLVERNALDLYENGGLECLPGLAKVFRHLDEIDESAAAVVQRLSVQAAGMAKGAREALDAVLRLKPEVLLTVMEHAAAEQAEILLAAWKHLPPTLQHRAPLDLGKLLHAESPGVRLTVLEMLEDPIPDAHLAIVAEMALTDPDKVVCERAREWVRGVFASVGESVE